MTATFHSRNPALQDSILVFNQDCELVSQLPMNRVNALKSLCHCEAGTEAAFITAFDTTAKMLKHYKEVAWYTEIWSSDELTHLLHKNGDKFVGRPL